MSNTATPPIMTQLIVLHRKHIMTTKTVWILLGHWHSVSERTAVAGVYSSLLKAKAAAEKAKNEWTRTSIVPFTVE